MNKQTEYVLKPDCSYCNENLRRLADTKGPRVLYLSKDILDEWYWHVLTYEEMIKVHQEGRYGQEKE